MAFSGIVALNLMTLDGIEAIWWCSLIPNMALNGVVLNCEVQHHLTQSLASNSLANGASVNQYLKYAFALVSIAF